MQVILIEKQQALITCKHSDEKFGHKVQIFLVKFLQEIKLIVSSALTKSWKKIR